MEKMKKDGVKKKRKKDIVKKNEGGEDFKEKKKWEWMSEKKEKYIGGSVLKWRVDGEKEIIWEIKGFNKGIILNNDGSIIVNIKRKREIIRIKWIRGRIGKKEILWNLKERFDNDGMWIEGGFIIVEGRVGDMIEEVNIDGEKRGIVGKGNKKEKKKIWIDDDRIFIKMGFKNYMV